MSHVVTVATKVRDAQAVANACQRLGLAQPTQGVADLFSGEASGVIVQLPGWLYPVVIDLATGEIRYDNYEGRWGEQSRLDQFLQMYAVEKAKLEAPRRATPSASNRSRTAPSASRLLRVREHDRPTPPPRSSRRFFHVRSTVAAPTPEAPREPGAGAICTGSLDGKTEKSLSRR